LTLKNFDRLDRLERLVDRKTIDSTWQTYDRLGRSTRSTTGLDATISEIMEDEFSQTQTAIGELVNCSPFNCMNINGKKTKEMIIGSLHRQLPPMLMISDQTVDQVLVVLSYLVLLLTQTLRWDHIAAVIDQECEFYGLKIYSRIFTNFKSSRILIFYYLK